MRIPVPSEGKTRDVCPLEKLTAVGDEFVMLWPLGSTVKGYIQYWRRKNPERNVAVRTIAEEDGRLAVRIKRIK